MVCMFWRWAALVALLVVGVEDGSTFPMIGVWGLVAESLATVVEAEVKGYRPAPVKK